MTILLWQTYYDNSIISIYEILLWSCVVRVRICTVSANTYGFDPVLWDRAGCLAPALCPWGVLATGCVHDTPPWCTMHDARCRMHDARMLGCSDARFDADWGFTHVQMSPAKSYKYVMCVCVCGQGVVCVACVVMCCLYTKLSPIPEQYVLRSHTTGRSPTICIVICYVCCICVQCPL